MQTVFEFFLDETKFFHETVSILSLFLSQTRQNPPLNLPTQSFGGAEGLSEDVSTFAGEE